jgi:hypothetical protein
VQSSMGSRGSSSSSGSGLRALVTPDTLLFFAAMCIMGLLAAFIGNFQFLFLKVRRRRGVA